MSKIQQILEEFDFASRENCENPQGRALWHLLEQYRDVLPEPNYYFTKAFRQCDVTDSGHADMAIWNLLNSKSSNKFWEIFKKHTVDNENNTLQYWRTDDDQLDTRPMRDITESSLPTLCCGKRTKPYSEIIMEDKNETLQTRRK